MVYNYKTQKNQYRSQSQNESIDKHLNRIVEKWHENRFQAQYLSIYDHFLQIIEQEIKW